MPFRTVKSEKIPTISSPALKDKTSMSTAICASQSAVVAVTEKPSWRLFVDHPREDMDKLSYE